MEHFLTRLQRGINNGTRSGVSRCFPGVYLYPFSGPPGGVRRRNQHYGRGVGFPVDLYGFESLGRVGGAGYQVEVVTGLDAGARARVSKP